MNMEITEQVPSSSNRLSSSEATLQMGKVLLALQTAFAFMSDGRLKSYNLRPFVGTLVHIAMVFTRLS